MRRAPIRIALTIAALALIFGLRYARDTRPSEPSQPAPRASDPIPHRAPGGPTVEISPAPAGGSTTVPTTTTPRTSGGSVAEAFRGRRSDVWVEGSGTVEATLPDDREGSRHQKFIVRLDRDLTVLVSHNIDLAPRVPLDRGDQVAFRGEYVWNQKGGLVHWTHRDPRGGRGGWIRLGDEVFE